MNLRRVLVGCILALVVGLPAHATPIVHHASVYGADELPPAESAAYADATVTSADPLRASLSTTVDLTLLSTYAPAGNGGSFASVESPLLAGIGAGLAFVSLHSSAFPAGEIRGLLQVAPEPATVALIFAGMAAIGWLFRRRRK